MFFNAKKALTRTLAGGLLSLTVAGMLWLGNWTSGAVKGVLSERRLVIKFLDVGQGDAIFVRTPSGKRILIDGGPDAQVVNYLDKEMGFGERRLDLVILTHPHADHLTGLVEVLKRYKINMIIQNNIEHTTSQYIRWLETILAKKIAVHEPKAGERIEMGDGVRLKVLWPLLGASPENQQRKFINVDLNETSIVLLLEYGDFRALFTGDVGKEVQREVMVTGKLERVTVLKVPHHGSKTALNYNFLEQIRPKLAVISAGKNNPFGHPHAKTIEMLQKLSIDIKRTDIDGTVVVETDGKTISKIKNQNAK